MAKTHFRIDCRNITYCNYDCETYAKELLKEIESQFRNQKARFEVEYGHNALLTLEYNDTKIYNNKITELIKSHSKNPRKLPLNNHRKLNQKRARNTTYLLLFKAQKQI